jgi:hypothetical protein
MGRVLLLASFQTSLQISHNPFYGHSAQAKITSRVQTMHRFALRKLLTAYTRQLLSADIIP